MKIRSVVLTLLLAVFCSTSALAREVPLDKQEYMRQRAEWIEEDRSMRRSAVLELDSLELAADRVLEELKTTWDTLATFEYPPANPFHEVRAVYDASELLTVMDALPKGALLHAHPSATGSFDLLIKATYDSSVYYYTGSDTHQTLHGTLAWSDTSPGEGWERIVDLRAAAEDVAVFDEELMQSITLGSEDMVGGDVWAEFQDNFIRMWGLVSAPEVWREHMLNTCRELASQNVQHVEFHTYIGPTRTPDGKVVPAEKSARFWRKIRSSIQAEYPNFDLKLVASIGRVNSPDRVRAYLQTVVVLKRHFPELIVGYDLVNEEDKTRTNLDFIDAILAAHRYADSLGVDFRPVIHSGESNRLDNENLFDALLLDAKRIGHGYALWTHPSLVEKAIEQDVALEVCPLSNQTLAYVADLRNHPAVEYLARGVPIVLSPDDPGMMSYRWSYDWVAATSAWDLSIADIKQLILDSFRYSGMDESEREWALQMWERDWSKWVTFIAEKGWK